MSGGTLVGREQTLTFDLASTQLYKGAAAILLLMHHGFQDSVDPMIFLGVEWTSNLMRFGKLCVAIYTFLSGYGLYKAWCRRTSLKKTFVRQLGNGYRYILGHLLQVMLVFWMIFAVTVLLASAAAGGISAIYPNHTVGYMLLDGMALSYFTRTPKCVNAWWYISAVVIYYLIFPILFLIVQHLKSWNAALIAVVLAVNAIFAFSPVVIYGIIFVIGMAVAELDWINRVLLSGKANPRLFLIKSLAVVLLTAAMIFIRMRGLGGNGNYYKWDVVLTFFGTFFAALLTHCRPVFKIFNFLGGISFEIFLFHPFFIRYMRPYVYHTPDAPFVFIRLLVAVLPSAWLLHQVWKRSGLAGWVRCIRGKLENI